MTDPPVDRWSSGGAMASAFLNFAHQSGFTTAAGTSYSTKGLALLASGGQFCYAYDTVADLAGSDSQEEKGSFHAPRPQYLF